LRGAEVMRLPRVVGNRGNRVVGGRKDGRLICNYALRGRRRK
jgi:hypothetical protein